MFSSILYAQKLNVEKLTITDTILPSRPLEYPIEGYMVSVNSGYSENSSEFTQKAKADYNLTMANWSTYVQETKDDHSIRLEEYENEVEKRKAEYKIKTDNWALQHSKLKGLSKLAHLDKKPEPINLPVKPIYREPKKYPFRAPDQSQAIFLDHKFLATNYLKLEGLKKGDNSNNVKIIVRILDFEKTDIIRVTSQSSTPTAPTWEREVRCRAEVTVMENDEVILKNIVPETEPYLKLSGKTSSELNKLKVQERSMINKTMKKVNRYINDQVGFTPEKVKLKIKTPSDKKRNYEDLKKAEFLVKESIDVMTNSVNEEKLTEALEIWKTAIEEADLEDKKSRINRKVTLALLKNIFQISMLIKDIDSMNFVMQKTQNITFKTFETNPLESRQRALDRLVQKMQANDLL